MFSIVYTTVPNKKEAVKISTALLEDKLAACVNIFPIDSIYLWEGKIQNCKELAMFIKTRKRLVGKVIKKVEKLHKYDIPCIISIPLEKGSKSFLKWLYQETK